MKEANSKKLYVCNDLKNQKTMILEQLPCYEQNLSVLK